VSVVYVVRKGSTGKGARKSRRRRNSKCTGPEIATHLIWNNVVKTVSKEESCRG
jgi:hypothetical protein